MIVDVANPEPAAPELDSPIDTPPAPELVPPPAAPDAPPVAASSVVVSAIAASTSAIVGSAPFLKSTWRPRFLPCFLRTRCSAYVRIGGRGCILPDGKTGTRETYPHSIPNPTPTRGCHDPESRFAARLARIALNLGLEVPPCAGPLSIVPEPESRASG